MDVLHVIPLSPANAVKFSGMSLEALVQLDKTQLVALCIGLPNNPPNAASKYTWLAHAISIRSQAVEQLAVVPMAVLGPPFGIPPAVDAGPVAGNPFGFPLFVNIAPGVNPFAAVPPCQARVALSLKALAELPFPPVEPWPHEFYTNYRAMSARVSLPGHYPTGSFLYCPSCAISDANPLTWARFLDIPEAAVFEVLQHTTHGSVVLRFLGFLAQLIAPVAADIAVGTEFVHATGLSVNGTVTIPLPPSVDTVMGAFHATLSHSLRQPADALLPPNHLWPGIAPPSVSTNDVLLAMTRQNQQMSLLCTSTTSVLPPAGRQPSASQSAFYPRVSRVLPLFNPSHTRLV
jgi:hypothetical protein